MRVSFFLCGFAVYKDAKADEAGRRERAAEMAGVETPEQLARAR
jgi:hypothetical protein